jgi:general secretion pathway protein A
MYLSHYGLKKKPFDISPDPEFLWLGEKHREGLAILKYGILENKGFLLITGDVGTGKTALIRAIEKELQTRAIVVTIPDPGMTLMDFYNYMAAELNMDRSFTNKGDFLIHFKRLILSAFASYRRVLLIIDESQRLNHDLMEEIRLLSNIDLAGKVLINIFFVGQTEFREILARQENRAVRQRITVSYHLAPLTEEEVRQYIHHRMTVAGASRAVFTAEALQAVSRTTQGYPRLINIICDHALMSGYSRGLKQVDAEIIQECADELKITIGRKPSDEKIPVVPPAAVAAAAAASGSAAADRQHSSRGALLFAICLLGMGLGWYVWGDSISDALARLGRGREVREIRSETDSRTADQTARPPTEPAATGPRAAAPPITQPAPTQPPASQPKPSAPVQPPASPPTPSPPTQQPESQPASSVPARTVSEARSSSAPLAQSESRPPAPVAPAAAPPPAASSPVGDTAAVAAEPFTLKGFTVYFTQNSIEIPVYANAMLASAAALMKSHPNTAAVIEGHTDSVGDPAYNKLVSENRAAAVKNFLVGQGISLSRLSVAGFGSEKPIETNSTPEGRSKNRRVVIRLVPAKSS